MYTYLITFIASKHGPIRAHSQELIKFLWTYCTLVYTYNHLYIALNLQGSYKLAMGLNQQLSISLC